MLLVFGLTLPGCSRMNVGTLLFFQGPTAKTHNTDDTILPRSLGIPELFKCLGDNTTTTN